MKKQILRAIIFCISLTFNVVNAQLQLPDSALYEGSLSWYKGTEKQLIAMTATVIKISDSSHIWRMVYAGGEIIKDYQLYWKGGNEYVMDENNGILLNCLALDGKLYCAYSLDSIRYQIVYEITPDSFSYLISYSEIAAAEEFRHENHIIRRHNFTGAQQASLKRK